MRVDYTLRGIVVNVGISNMVHNGRGVYTCKCDGYLTNICIIFDYFPNPHSY